MAQPNLDKDWWELSSLWLAGSGVGGAQIFQMPSGSQVWCSITDIIGNYLLKEATLAIKNCTINFLRFLPYLEKKHFENMSIKQDIQLGYDKL